MSSLRTGRIALALCSALALVGCGLGVATPAPSNGPLYLVSTLVPAPVVNLPVIWHIEVGVSPSYDQTFPSHLLIDLPPEVEFVSGDRNWSGDLTRDISHQVDLVIRVLKPGTYQISALVYSGDPGGTSFGGSQTLILTSDATSASFIDILDLPTPLIPTPYQLP